MTQFNVTLTDAPQAVAGPGAAMFEGRDDTVLYWFSASTPATSVLPFVMASGVREPMVVPDGVNLYLAGRGQAVVYKTSDPA